MNKWDLRYLKLVAEISTWSKDPKKVACVLVDEKNHIISTGYNGPPHGISDKYTTKEEKLAKTIHAEANALLKAGRPIHTAYITCLPCSNCMAMLIQQEVKRIVVAQDTISKKWNPFITFAMAEEAEVLIEVIPNELS